MPNVCPIGYYLQQGTWQNGLLLMNEDQSKGLGATWQTESAIRQQQPMKKMLEMLDSAYT